MLTHMAQARSCIELLKELVIDQNQPKGERLVFSGVSDRDVYNIAAPFLDNGELVIAGRVEARHKEASEVIFFVNRKGEWVPRNNAPIFALQDPFFSFINGELVFGGVEVYFDSEDSDYVTSWRTVFFRGNSINELESFAQGPLTMKDIRLVELASGNIGVFTRPMVVDGARALIGYVEINNLSELTEEKILAAELFRNQFLLDEWGGVNEARLLSNGKIGVLGHIAYMEESNIRHYYPMVYCFDPELRNNSPIKLIASRAMFQEGPAKRTDLQDVLFSGGIVRHSNGTASLYTGVSDSEAHVIVIADPFLEYEK
ncbi:MAG: DUF1861 family protein [Candidatus Cohnella colombiensis]|uniref:DUF1861 family protein n=1 Tax=Candidatus Cohnella colombiensis TaxID=3121368 RepID=A0AA95JFC7_9BACL|nr:MAG: DUF1861 family protein [Cohnella sp.]